MVLARSHCLAYSTPVKVLIAFRFRKKKQKECQSQVIRNDYTKVVSPKMKECARGGKCEFLRCPWVARWIKTEYAKAPEEGPNGKSEDGKD